ncbi:MAG TPA: hypothetical protein ENN09_05300 [Planctomycetes bacterium]|nr:hypothetical protein [Planctomycetota bacterium]
MHFFAAVLLCAAPFARAVETPPGVSRPESGRPHDAPSVPVHEAWAVSYAPLVVTEGEPVTMVLRGTGAAPPSGVRLEKEGARARLPQPGVETNGQETVLRFTPDGPGRYALRGHGLNLRLLIAADIKDLSAAAPLVHRLVAADGEILILYHGRRVIRESRRWYMVRRTVSALMPDALPLQTLVVLPGPVREGAPHHPTGLAPLAEALLSSGLPGPRIVETAAGGISPLLSLLCSLGARPEEFSAQTRSVILLLPPGEWEGGIPPDDYCRAVEWLLDRFIAAGARRLLVVGPFGAGTAPERAAEFRSAAGAAAATRRAAHISTEDFIGIDELRETADGPVTDVPRRDVQSRLAREIVSALRKSPVVPPAPGD